MNLIKIIASNWSNSKYRKAQKCDLVICEQVRREPWYNMASKMAAEEERFDCGFFSYINLSEIFMSEICFNCNECLCPL